MPDDLIFGQVQWHSSDEDSGPDVGVAIGLRDGARLWIGEISRKRWEAGGGDAMGLGSDMGSWIVLYPSGCEPMVIGRLSDELIACEAGDQIAATLRPNPQPW